MAVAREKEALHLGDIGTSCNQIVVFVYQELHWIHRTCKQEGNDLSFFSTITQPYFKTIQGTEANLKEINQINCRYLRTDKAINFQKFADNI